MSLAVQSLAATTASASAAPDTAVNRRKDVPIAALASETDGGAAAWKGRHALLGAVTDALEGLGLVATSHTASAAREEPSTGDHESKQPLQAFVHELFAALRPVESEGRMGRGFAWGRTSSADFGLRLDALVRSLQGPVQAPSEPPVLAPLPEASAPVPPAVVGTPEGETPSAAAPTPHAPESPLTRTAQAPAETLLPAFQRLLDGAPPGNDSGADPGTATETLIAFLQRLAQAMTSADASGSVVAGALLDVTV
jgi:hypothetical protein